MANRFHPKPRSKKGRKVARKRAAARVRIMKMLTDPSRRRNRN